MSIKSKLIKMYRHRPFWREIKRLKGNRKAFWKEAVKKFEEDKPVHGSLADYKKALYRHRISYEEYMLFEFWRLDEKERREFVTEKEMNCIYRKTIQPDVAWRFRKKDQTLVMFSEFVHRKWMDVEKTSFDSFSEFVSSNDCILKPRAGTYGLGIRKVKKDEPKDMQELYRYCLENNMIVEECVKECEELEAFHPQSLNTIRAFTMSKDGKCELLSAVFRMGMGGNVVDNGGVGGIFTSIDVNTGQILTDAVNNKGVGYYAHPDSGKVIKGSFIPYWDNVIEACKKLTALVSGLVFIGWDLCVLPNGEVELIEANAASSPLPLQAPLKKGIGPRMKVAGEEILGYNPMKLISIWSKSYVD